MSFRPLKPPSFTAAGSRNHMLGTLLEAFEVWDPLMVMGADDLYLGPLNPSTWDNSKVSF